VCVVLPDFVYPWFALRRFGANGGSELAEFERVIAYKYRNKAQYGVLGAKLSVFSAS
jgi:hypothetical protein